MYFSEKLMKIPTIQRKAAIRAAYWNLFRRFNDFFLKLGFG